MSLELHANLRADGVGEAEGKEGGSTELARREKFGKKVVVKAIWAIEMEGKLKNYQSAKGDGMGEI